MLFEFLGIKREQLVNKTKIIVCNEEVKKEILTFNFTNKLLENIKIISPEEAIDMMLLKIDTVAAKYYIKKNYSISIEEATDIVKVMSNIDTESEYLDNNLNKMQSMKKELMEQNIVTVPILKGKEERYQFIVLGDIRNKKLENILKSNKNTIFKKYQINENKITDVLNFKSIHEEVQYNINKIFMLLESGVDMNDIRVYYPTNEYKILLNLYLKMYGVTLEEAEKRKLYSFNETRDIIKDLESDRFDETFEKYSRFDNKKIINQVLDVLNKYMYLASEFMNIRDLIIDELMKMEYKNENKIKGIRLIDISEALIEYQNKHVFILGFNQGLIPEVKKDNDYMSDDMKKIVGMYTSSEVNESLKKNLLINISNLKNVHISYSINHLSKSYEKSNLLKEIPHKVAINNDKVSYIKELNTLFFFKEKENFIKYNHESEAYRKYRELDDSERYINRYTKIKREVEVLNISSTQLETFFSCSYKYYLKYILYLRKSTTTNALLGNFFHYILENVVKLDVSIEQIKKFVELKTADFISENNERLKLTNSQKYYLRKQEEKLVFLLENLFMEFELRGFNDDILCELEMSKKLNNGLNLKGKADLVLEKDVKDELFIEIYDYKTGNITNDLEMIEYGFNMQNLIYYILLKEYYKKEHFNLNGLYKQKIKSGTLKNEEQLLEQFEISGYSDDKEEVKFKRKKVKNLSDVDLDKLEQQVIENIDKMNNDINNNKFEINPKIIDKDNKACSYCEFFEICNKTIDDYEYIEK